MQPQGHVQVLLNMIDFGMNPQEALDMPRFCIESGEAGGHVLIEDGISKDTLAELKAMCVRTYCLLCGSRLCRLDCLPSVLPLTRCDLRRGHDARPVASFARSVFGAPAARSFSSLILPVLALQAAGR